MKGDGLKYGRSCSYSRDCSQCESGETQIVAITVKSK